MGSIRKNTFAALLTVLALANAGCQLLPHDMKPHRLWRWNRGPAPSTERFYSGLDPDTPTAPAQFDETSDALSCPTRVSDGVHEALSDDPESPGSSPGGVGPGDSGIASRRGGCDLAVGGIIPVKRLASSC